MKITNHGNLDHSCCNLVKLNNVHIMLDCAANVASLTPFLPFSALQTPRLENLPSHPDMPGVLKKTPGGMLLVDSSLHLVPPDQVDVSLIDAILITNNSQMSALPFIMTDPDFHGRVYATEPCVLMGRLALIALCKYIEQCPTRRSEVDMNSIPSHVHSIFKQKSHMRQVYNKDVIDSCFAKITPVRYNEQVDLFGLVDCVPLPAGHSIGSANWVIKAGDYKISYVSSSSKLTNHTLPMEVISLANPDVLLLSNLSLNPMYFPDNTLSEVCNVVTSTVKSGGNVLIPCHSTGVILDLIEWLIQNLNKNSLSDVPIIIVSPVADAALAHPDIYGEWLNDAKQAKLYIPELPFQHSQLIKSKRIHHFSNVADGMREVYKTPCIVFAGHPSLRCGDAVLLLEKWRDDTHNAVILIESEFSFATTLAPFLPMSMRSYFCPIDPSINYSQASKLIKDIRPKTVVTSPTYFRAPVTHPNRCDLVLVSDAPVVELGVGETVNLQQPKTSINVELSLEQLDQLNMQPLKTSDGYQLVSNVSGMLKARDNKPTLGAPNPSSLRSAMYGEVELQELIAVLTSKGLTPNKVETLGAGDHFLITLSDHSSTITLSPNVTSISAHTGKMRHTLQGIVSSLLVSL
ncbi:hypothetical protein ACHWQZ_G002186 [Mnemiopsis leidyi]